MIDLTNYLPPDEDLIVSARRALMALTENVITTNDDNNVEFPQIIVGVQNDIDQPDFKNANQMRYTLKVDIYVDLDEAFIGMRMRRVVEKLLTKLQLERYASRYVPGSLSSPTLEDNSTSRPLWHGVILLDYLLIFMKEEEI
ncbi:hypothetical protein FEZ51_02135 [Pediococcus stilesii]|uniref:DUF3168 domain-containing protein n=1 Tax=Pediococcus stilesii TaxID=331679 RepID=A0A5R9BXS1_9LACO|nr:hypothetical protein [Pediococcus stilesii]TLQ05479.1 hypothetical protein FEZ51_02135 [Pediococcus stilesii]